MGSFESRMNPKFLAESEKGMLWKPRVIKSGRGTVEGFKEDEKGKRRASVLSSFSLSWFSVIHVLVRLFTERSRFLELCVICKKLIVYRVVSYDIGKRRSGQVEENGPQYWALRHTWGTPYMSCDGDEDELLTEVDWYLSERWLECSRLNAKNRRERRIWLLIVSKVAERSNKRRTEMLSLSRADCLQ